MTDAIKIIENGYVFTGDARRRAGRLALLIRNDRITEIGPRGDTFRSLYPGAEIVNAAGRIVLPGFVDAHLHGESVVLSAVTDGKLLTRWERDAEIRRATEYLTKAGADDLRIVYETAYYAAVKSGVTTVAESGRSEPEHAAAAIVDAARRAEIRALIALHTGDQAELAEKAKHPSLRFAVPMPDEESLTTYNLQTTVRTARDRQWSVMVAHAETRRSHEILKKNFRRSLMRLLEDYGIFEVPLQLSHLAYFDDGELDLLARAGTPIIMSPRAVLRKGTDMPPVAEFLRRKIPVALATDWGVPDPLAEVRAFAEVVSLIGLSVPRGDDLLAMITSIPARALGMQQEIGSLEPGKKADITFLKADDLRFAASAPWDHPSAVLGLVTGGSAGTRVSDVMINGEFLVREGNILTYAEEDLIRQGQALRLRMHGERTDEAESMRAERPAPSVLPAVRSDESEQPFEEGFRIVRREDVSDAGLGTVLPLKPAESMKSDLPRNVRKVFGDDEV